MDCARAFLCLTAGLDSRAVFAGIVRSGGHPDIVTLSGRRLSLDARRAALLGRAYAIRHTVIQPTRAFYDGIDQRVEEAVRRSGGLSGLDQALEIEMYRALEGRYAVRLSGNLGNQVGRSGTEGVGVEPLPPYLFSPEVRQALDRLPAHRMAWLQDQDGNLSPRVLIQQENLYCSLGNASIGSSYALQRTPYADRTLIENKFAEPPALNGARLSAISVRWRDLKHRLMGPDFSSSFQRKVLSVAGGCIAELPVNWGWRAAGGWSPSGFMLGATCALDIMAERGQGPRFATHVLEAFGLRGLAGFQHDESLRHERVAEFVFDHLTSALGHGSPVLESSGLRRLVSARREGLSLANASRVLTLILADREFSANRAPLSMPSERSAA
jgi:hypothetical protein